MKRIIKGFTLACVLILLVGTILVASPSCRKAEEHQPITQELINLVEKNPEIRNMLEKSITEAKKVNPDPKTNPVQSLSDYYNFIDRTSKSLPHELLSQDTLKALSSSTSSDQMLQCIFYFYFLVDQYLPQLEDKGLYKPRLQYYEPFASWLGKFSRTWGAFLDTEESWNEKIYQQLYNDPTIGLQKGWYESSSNWKTFNQFFSRKLKSPDMRPIASPDDWAVVVSPADSVPQGVWAIDENSNIKVKEGVKTKIVTIYHVKDLLGEDSQYKNAFANGVLTHTFLSVFDYHRYHFAVGGLVREMKVITKNYSLETGWDPDNSRYLCHDSTGWQFYHTHGYVIVDTGNAGYGLVALVPMGMAQVSSVNFEPDVKVGSVHKKGDMLGHFLFGGSDFVMLFQKQAGFELTAQEGEHMLMGEKYGMMKWQAK